ncbi:M23 family metallopeptidase [bacterium]|nr:M23 family metallopeptidase [bacterium]
MLGFSRTIYVVSLVVCSLLLATCSSSRKRGASAGRDRYSKYQPDGRIAFAWPLNRIKITSYYGWRRGGRLHDGLDLKEQKGANIYASEAGRVIHRGWIRGYGYTVMIDHGGGWSSLYAHLSAYAVSAGQIVKQRQVIGKVGRSGRASGSHLHFEIRKNSDPLDPLPLMPKNR